MDRILETKTVLLDALDRILQGVVQLAPQALAAFAILLIGALCAKVIEWIVRGTLRRVRFDALLENLHVAPTLSRISTREPSALIARMTYWILIIFLLQAAAEVLGLQGASDAVREAAGYLPNVFGALVLVLLGIFAANALARIVALAAEPLGRGYAKALGRAAATVVLVVVGIMAISQLQIQTAVLQAILLTFLVGGMLAVALTFGLGSREITRNMLAGFYARKLFHSGDEVHISGEKGTLVSITPLQTVVETRGSLKAIPNEVYLRSVVEKKNS